MLGTISICPGRFASIASMSSSVMTSQLPQTVLGIDSLAEIDSYAILGLCFGREIQSLTAL